MGERTRSGWRALQMWKEVIFRVFSVAGRLALCGGCDELFVPLSFCCCFVTEFYEVEHRSYLPSVVTSACSCNPVVQ